MNAERGRGGRPRSEEARTAVLRAVDDLLVEVGYAAMTMKGIAERAGVSRMTVYRWWSTKAEILLEASAADAKEELATGLTGVPVDDLTSYLESLVRFLVRSPAGMAYRALIGEAQHDPAVAALLASTDVLGGSAGDLLDSVLSAENIPIPRDRAKALLIGPVFFAILSGQDPSTIGVTDLAEAFLRGIGARARPPALDPDALRT